MSEIIYGSEVAASIKEELKQEISLIKEDFLNCVLY